MIDKIIDNSNDDKFRTIKKTNQTMIDNIFKYKSGI